MWGLESRFIISARSAERFAVTRARDSVPGVVQRLDDAAQRHVAAGTVPGRALGAVCGEIVQSGHQQQHGAVPGVVCVEAVPPVFLGQVHDAVGAGGQRGAAGAGEDEGDRRRARAAGGREERAPVQLLRPPIVAMVLRRARS
jgi:hypothetical protein